MQDEPEAGDRSCWGLTIKVNNKPGMSVDDIRVFLKGSGAVHFEGEKKEEVYAWVSGCLGEQNWAELGRTARGLVRRYMEKMTGLSRAQITRLITRYGEDGKVRVKRSRRHSFATVYSREDVALLVSVDEAHETLSGPATQKILQRQCSPAPASPAVRRARSGAVPGRAREPARRCVSRPDSSPWRRRRVCCPSS